MARIALGFDPAFLDLSVTLFDDYGEVLKDLPNIGKHIRNSRIEKRAGGNGVNLARTLVHLGYTPILVCPLNPEFTQLLSDSGITKVHKINSIINTTIALELSEGEIQINNVVGSIGRVNWTHEIQNLWINSQYHIFLNWGLNPSSVEWVTCQWLALCKVEYDNIVEKNTLNPFDYQTSKTFILDPGSIKEHENKNTLIKLLQYFISMEKAILICNEEESIEFLRLNPNKLIIHSAEKVIIHWRGEVQEIVVPALTSPPVSFLGAGDAFLAGIIDSLNRGKVGPVEMVNNGIKVAQQYIIKQFN